MMVIEGRVFYGGELQPLSLGVEDGVIKKIGKSLRGDDRHDFGNMVILPGGVDVHVHFREPGLTHKEDFSTGTHAAATGGVTSVLDMPNTLPPTTDSKALTEKRELVSRKASVDFGLFGGVESVKAFSALGKDCQGYKLYMAESFGSPGMPPREISAILRGLKTASRRMTVHAEDPTMLRSVEERNLLDHDRARPESAEEAAIKRLISSDGPSVHVAHLSSQAGLVSLEGSRLSSEVTPMHLLHDVGSSLGPMGKINPPLRRRESRDALWAAFEADRIDVLASDHAPHTLEEKEEFATAPSGAPNVETTYPLMFRLVKAGTLSLQVLVRAFCMNPAKLFGLRGKGELREGGDADLVVFDSRRVEKVTADDLHYKCGWTPFEGWEAIFPVATFLRGELIASGRELESTGLGRWIPQAPVQEPRGDIRPGS